MEEKEILKLLSNFRKIKPEKNWALFVKRKILGKEAQIFPFLNPVYAFLFLILIFAGILQISQKALPGEPLYAFKRLTEKVKAAFVSEKEKIVFDLAQKRAEELAEVARKNEIKKLPPAIKEFQASAFEAANVLVKSNKISKENLQKTLTTIQRIKEVEENLKAEVLPSAFDKAVENKVKSIIEDLEKVSLTKEQKEILESAKEDLKKNEIEKAFTKVMLILQNE